MRINLCRNLKESIGIETGISSIGLVLREIRRLRLGTNIHSPLQVHYSINQMAANRLEEDDQQ